jgi:hypothetical protein
MGVLPCWTARAQSPFDLEAVGWKSYENFDASAERHAPRESAPLPVEEPVKTAKQSEKISIGRQESPPPLSFRTPPLPGMNNGYHVEVSSTSDKRQKEEDTLEGEQSADIALPDKNWKPLSIKPPVKAASEDDSEAEGKPLEVRMSYLPSRNVKQSPALERESAARKGHEYMRKLAEEKRNAHVPKATTPEEAAACKALEDLKKQQLVAIQRDRETLKALQEAIRSLGLSKQLDFITEQDSFLSTPVNGMSVSATPLTASAPANTSIR